MDHLKTRISFIIIYICIKLSTIRQRYTSNHILGAACDDRGVFRVSTLLGTLGATYFNRINVPSIPNAAPRQIKRVVVFFGC